MTTPASNYDLHDSIGYWVTRVYRSMRSHYDDLLADQGLASGLWPFIGALGNGRARSPSDLADFIGMDRSAVTRQLDRLEHQGLLRRKANPDDRRSTLLELTAKGKRLYPVLARVSKSTNEHFLRGVTKSEQKAFRATLDKILRNVTSDVSTL